MTIVRCIGGPKAGEVIRVKTGRAEFCVIEKATPLTAFAGSAKRPESADVGREINYRIHEVKFGLGSIYFGMPEDIDLKVGVNELWLAYQRDHGLPEIM